MLSGKGIPGVRQFSVLIAGSRIKCFGEGPLFLEGFGGAHKNIGDVVGDMKAIILIFHNLCGAI